MSNKNSVLTIDREELQREMERLAYAVREQCRHAAVCAPLHGKYPEDMISDVDVDDFVHTAMENIG